MKKCRPNEPRFLALSSLLVLVLLILQIYRRQFRLNYPKNINYNLKTFNNINNKNPYIQFEYQLHLFFTFNDGQSWLRKFLVAVSVWTWTLFIFWAINKFYINIRLYKVFFFLHLGHHTIARQKKRYTKDISFNI